MAPSKSAFKGNEDLRKEKRNKQEEEQQEQEEQGSILQHCILVGIVIQMVRSLESRASVILIPYSVTYFTLPTLLYPPTRSKTDFGPE